MRVIKGKLENLLDKEVVSLGNPDDYISAVITDEDYIMDAIGKLRNVYKNILRLEYQNKRTAIIIGNNTIDVDNPDKKSEIELFSEFYEKQNNIELDQERLVIVNKIIKESLERNI